MHSSAFTNSDCSTKSFSEADESLRLPTCRNKPERPFRAGRAARRVLIVSPNKYEYRQNYSAIYQPRSRANCIAGCATGPKFASVNKVPDGKALIYVYRMFNIPRSPASSHRGYATGKLVADVANASYYSIYCVSRQGHVFFKVRVHQSDY